MSKTTTSPRQKCDEAQDENQHHSFRCARRARVISTVNRFKSRMCRRAFQTNSRNVLYGLLSTELFTGHAIQKIPVKLAEAEVHVRPGPVRPQDVAASLRTRPQTLAWCPAPLRLFFALSHCLQKAHPMAHLDCQHAKG